MAIDPENLKRLRNKSGLTQGQLAKAAGISQQLVGAIEKGNVKTTRHVYAVARALEVDPSALDPAIPGDEVRLAPTLDWGDELKPRAENERLPILGVLPAKKTDGFDALVRVPIESRSRIARGSFGVYIADESMMPRYEVGEVIEGKVGVPISRNTDIILFDGGFHTMSDASGFSAKMVVCRLVDWSDDEWVIQKYNPERVIHLSREQWPVAVAIVAHHMA